MYLFYKYSEIIYFNIMNIYCTEREIYLYILVEFCETKTKKKSMELKKYNKTSTYQMQMLDISPRNTKYIDLRTYLLCNTHNRFTLNI